MKDILIKELNEHGAKQLSHRIKKLNLEQEVKNLTNYLPADTNNSQRSWHIINNVGDIKCACGAPLKYKEFSTGYTKFCSKECVELKNSKSEFTRIQQASFSAEKRKEIESAKEATCMKNHQHPRQSKKNRKNHAAVYTDSSKVKIITDKVAKTKEKNKSKKLEE